MESGGHSSLLSLNLELVMTYSVEESGGRKAPRSLDSADRSHQRTSNLMEDKAILLRRSTSLHSFEIEGRVHNSQGGHLKKVLNLLGSIPSVAS